jgi:hypothetical protein
VLICSERKVLLADCWWLVCSERKVLVAAKLNEHFGFPYGLASPAGRGSRLTLYVRTLRGCGRTCKDPSSYVHVKAEVSTIETINGPATS